MAQTLTQGDCISSITSGLITSLDICFFVPYN